MMWVFIPALIIIGYLLGSIPFGIVIGKKIRGIDLREVGSGNIGTANAIRALGPFWGGIVFVGDVLKGSMPVLLSIIYLPKFIPELIPANVLPYCNVLVGLAAILGHNNSIFLKFKGGKGIATSFGVFLTLDWKSSLLALLIWGLIVLVTKISSLGSLTAALSFPIFMRIFKMPIPYIVFACVATSLAFYKHRSNIARILKGEERKITDKVEDTDENAAKSNVIENYSESTG